MALDAATQVALIELANKMASPGANTQADMAVRFRAFYRYLSASVAAGGMPSQNGPTDYHQKELAESEKLLAALK